MKAIPYESREHRTRRSAERVALHAVVFLLALAGVGLLLRNPGILLFCLFGVAVSAAALLAVYSDTGGIWPPH